MAFAILHVLLKELKEDKKAVFPEALNTSMIFSGSGGWEEMAIDQRELPPIKQYKGDRE